MLARQVRNLCGCPASSRSPPSATPRRNRSTTSVAPPYDVLSDADVDALAERDAHNIVAHRRAARGRRPDRYDAAAATCCTRWLADGVLVADDAPTFTLYRMRFTDEAGAAPRPVGVIGALEVVDEGAGGVLPHERTTPKATTDRLDLTRATNANLSPVWGLSLTARAHRPARRRPASRSARCTDEAGVVHTRRAGDRPGPRRRDRRRGRRQPGADRRRPPPLRRQPRRTATRCAPRTAATTPRPS